MTQKYQGALAVARTVATIHLNDSKALYRSLNAHNWYWNSKVGVWERGSRAQKPTDLVRVRVWAATEVVEQAADDVAFSLLNSDYQLVERSEPYVCRPPKQLESRIYLRFLPTSFGRK